MRSILSLFTVFIVSGTTILAQDHGSVTFNGQTVQLTGYRTRISNEKRWIIAEGNKDGKLYSITVTVKPDITQRNSISTDATHTATLTVSNADYSNAQNYCFDGGSPMAIIPQNGKFTVSGKDMQSGNCFGKSKGNDKLSFIMKP